MGIFYEDDQFVWVEPFVSPIRCLFSILLKQTESPNSRASMPVESEAEDTTLAISNDNTTSWTSQSLEIERWKEDGYMIMPILLVRVESRHTIMRRTYLTRLHNSPSRRLFFLTHSSSRQQLKETNPHDSERSPLEAMSSSF